MRIRKKIVNGHEYYYLEESIRTDKPKTYSYFLGKQIPNEEELKLLEKQLIGKIYQDLLKGRKRIYLREEELIEAEKHRLRYLEKTKHLSKAKHEEKEEVDTVNFVYTTLTTEGVLITKEDANLAYKFSGKNIRNLRDINLQVALDMIKGLRYVKESKKGITKNFLLSLHGLIMSEYKLNKPGEFRKKQTYIFLKSYDRVEEIKFRPPSPGFIDKKIAELIKWYNSNFEKLNGIELAALLHLRFYMIHPFEDGNKRMARLLLNKAFFDCNYPLLNISKDTKKYFDALIKSVEKKDEKPFVDFVFSQFISYIR